MSPFDGYLSVTKGPTRSFGLLAGALFVLVGAAQSHGTSTSIPIHDVRLVGEVPAESWTYVTLNTAPDGTPITTYTVPLDRYFVVTSAWICSSAEADGQDISTRLSVLNQGNTGNGTRVVIMPGETLTVGYGGFCGIGYLWGYLEPVR